MSENDDFGNSIFGSEKHGAYDVTRSSSTTNLHRFPASVITDPGKNELDFL